MKISEILKSKGIFANDIRQRFRNKQIKLNGDVVSDMDLDIKEDILDAGDFLFRLTLDNPIFGTQLRFFDFETFNQSNVDNDLRKILNKFHVIRFSKKDLIIVEKN